MVASSQYKEGPSYIHVLTTAVTGMEAPRISADILQKKPLVSLTGGRIDIGIPTRLHRIELQSICK
jgi:hypothetical protein